MESFFGSGKTSSSDYIEEEGEEEEDSSSSSDEEVQRNMPPSTMMQSPATSKKQSKSQGTCTTTVSALKRSQNVIAVECDPLQVKFIEQRVTTLKELPDEFQEVGMKSMASDPRFFDAFGEPQFLIGSEKIGEIVDLVDFEPDNVEVEEQASDTPVQITSMGEETRNEEEEDLPIQA
ncbi:hypothetical protein L7F22_065201 [Adiantum nelumboides]|nr:hypothetical protein [Adiantum nelumboides]